MRLGEEREGAVAGKLLITGAAGQLGQALVQAGHPAGLGGGGHRSPMTWTSPTPNWCRENCPGSARRW